MCAVSPLALLIVVACSGEEKADLPTDSDAGSNSPHTGAAITTDTGADTDTHSGTHIEEGYVEVPASTFDMGCTPGQGSDCDEDETLHTVTLTHAYLLGRTEVTQGQFAAVMGYNPSYFVECGEDCPVQSLSWDEAAAYANAVSAASGLQECYRCAGIGPSVECSVAMNPYACTGYRLPTEAEWEGAARCGTDLKYAGSEDPHTVAWTSENSGAMPHVVGRLGANACGLYDMSGNVWEWTQDWYDDLGSGTVTDPAGPASPGTAFQRVVRGGSWYYTATSARVSKRRIVWEWYAYYGSVGFRLSRSLP